MIASRLRTAAFLVAACSFAAGPATAQQTGGISVVAIEASRLALSPDGLEVIAEGGVRLEAGGFALETERLSLSLDGGAIRLDAPFSLVTADAELRADSGVLSPGGRALRLERPELLRLRPPPALAMGGERLACGGGVCTLRDAWGTACPHRPSGYRIEADEIVLHPSGDVDLKGPALVLGGAKVMKLPWLRLRPEREPGFLAPRLGYSRKAGLIAGPAGHIPLGATAHADGFVAGRTADGLEDGTRLLAPGVDLNVEHVYSAPDDNAARMRLALRAPLAGAAFAADADVVTDRGIVDDLTFDPLERAASHTASRVLLSLPTGPMLWESALGASQALIDRAAGEWPGFASAASVRGSLVALPNAAHLWPALDVGFERRDASGTALTDALAAVTKPHTVLFAAPSLAAPSRVGPLAFALGAGSRHAVWLADGDSDAPSARHDLFAAAEIALPLMGKPAGTVHLVTPRLAYRVVPLVEGESPPWAFSAADRAREGHAVEAGLHTALDPFGRVPLAEMSAGERVFLPGLGDDDAAYLFARLGVGAKWLSLTGEIAWDQRRNTVSAAAAGIGTQDDRGDGVSIDARFYGRGDGPHLDGSWAGASDAWPGGGALIAPAEDLLELAPRASAVLGRFVVLSAGARVEVFPRAGLDALWYGLSLRSSCGCAELGVRAAHRLDTWIPDLLLTLVLL